jgi:hypothetical protein
MLLSWRKDGCDNLDVMGTMRGENAAGWSIFCAMALAACGSKKPVDDTYFDRTISPILESSCVHTNTGANCHVVNDRGNAIGNLSLATYEELIKRRDLLVNYGPYTMPAMLLKNVEPLELLLTAYDGTSFTVETDIRHAGGRTLGQTSSGFHTIQQWIAGGANANNAASPAAEVVRDPCSTTIPSDPSFDPNVDPAGPDFAQFKRDVMPILGANCAAGNCHGSPANALRLVCAGGDNPDALARWNYFAAVQYLTTKAEAISSSELLRRPLDPRAGGVYHEGGIIFASSADSPYATLVDWATQHGPNTNLPSDPGFDFFAKRVQPMLVKKGCMMLGCHSPAMFHDYRLHAGSGGNFSLPTTLTNYRLTREQIALESIEPSASRLIAKNLIRPDEEPGARGILHRGGALFDDFGQQLASPSLCDLSPGGSAEMGDLDRQHAYCVVLRWMEIERQAKSLAPLRGFVYVKRAPAPEPDRPQDYDKYAPSADLCFSPLSVDAATGAISSGGGGCRSLLAGCAGLSPASADIRHPSVSWKGDTIAFAARNSAAEPYAIWTVNVDGSACAKNDAIAAAPGVSGWTDNGALVHNFDPTFTPDDRIVFASTRGNVMNVDAFDYRGPTRTPADPSRWNANLYVLESSGQVRQLTFLLNQEILPSMMSDGRLVFTAEKRAPGFYQLAGRRMNLDGGDYHPLYAQRRTIGFDQMTEVVELANKNLAAIFGDQGAAHGAGTLGFINRSVGPDQRSTNPEDFTEDPSAVGLPDDPLYAKFYLHSFRLPDPAVTGHVGAGNGGAYRSPAPLPNGNLLVSYAANAMDLASFSGNFDIYMIDEASGQKTQMTSDASTDELFPAAVYERENRGVFASRADEANANTRVYRDGEDAAHPTNVSEITVLSAPILGSLLFQNTRSGRPLPAFGSFEVYEDLPPAGADVSAGTTTDAYGSVYTRRRLLGLVPVLFDGSARFTVPGGVPLVLRAPFALDGKPASLQYQREEMQFYPGEYAHQSFPEKFFNGFCGGCHGSVSGREDDLALVPDILTQASRVAARSAPSAPLANPPGSRGPEVGAN